MSIKKSLTMAVGLCVAGLAASQSAQANVYAGSQLQITNLQVAIGGVGVQIPGYGFSTSTSAELNGNTAGDADSCGTVGIADTPCSTTSPVLKSDVANAPGSQVVRADTDYGLLGIKDQRYANANAEISSAQLVQGLPTSLLQVAEANLVLNGSASASTSVQSNTNLVFFFQAEPNATVTITFDALLEQYAEINNAALGVSPTFDANAQYSSSVSANIGNAGWTSDGASNNCGTATNDCNDPQDNTKLTLTNSTGAGQINLPGGGTAPYGDPSSVSNSTGGIQTFEIVLNTGFCGSEQGVCTYTLNLAATTGVVIRNTVPAPGSLALMGIGLLAASRLRGKKKAKATIA